MKTFYWLVKREFWEHRGSFLWTPIVVGSVFLVLNLMGIIAAEVMGGHNISINGNNIAEMVRDMNSGQMATVGAGLDAAMYSSTATTCAVLAFVVFFYCLGALYNDRVNRSLLFWKSLPISDTSTVLSKVASATVVAPAIALVCGAITGFLVLLMYALVLSMHGISVWQLLTLAHPFRVIANLVGSIPLYVLWALPTVGWLMLCSAWARSKPIMWALLLPIGTGLILSWFNVMATERLGSVYWHSVFSRLLLSVVPGGWLSVTPHDWNGDKDPVSMLSAMDLSNSYQALGSANLWIGVAAGLAMIAGAIWFRRWRDEA
jgi:ABC-2 type transport system permease protein